MTDEEIVVACAENLMGWQKIPSDIMFNADGWCWGLRKETPEGPFKSISTSFASPAWNPLASEADNARVLDKMALNGWMVRLTSSGMFPVEWYCTISDFEVDVTDEDRKRAVCMAALKAVGVAM